MRGFVIWLTGLPGSGKTTIAEKLETQLREKGIKVESLDGDEVRKNLSPELKFSKADRQTHARRVVYVSRLLARNDVAVLVALISPYREFRAYARKEIGNFVEVYTKCSLEKCMERDPKGLYRLAKEGKITDLTGLQDPYEEPLSPEVVVDTETQSADESTSQIMEQIHALDYI